MKRFYRIEDGKAIVGIGEIIPIGNIEYVLGQEPQELIDGLAYKLPAERIAEINSRLNTIDMESVRPLRAINNGTQTVADIDKLNNLDIEADALRTERATLI